VRKCRSQAIFWANWLNAGASQNRVEHFHADCYDEASKPYGDPAEKA
jgi:hypothetical protein